VMTQERLHDLLMKGDVRFDYFFVDEAHNISDKSRGVLLHVTIEKVLESSLPQIIISMPSKQYQDSFSGIFKDFDFSRKITSESPVSKILISVDPRGRNLFVSRFGSNSGVSIPKG